MSAQARPVLYVRGRIFATGYLPIATNSVVLSGDFEAHSHDFLEIVLLTRGCGTHLTAHGRHPLNAGDALVLQPGAWHAYLACRDLAVTNCCVGRDVLERELAWTHDDPLLNHLLHTGSHTIGRHGIVPLRILDPALSRCLRHLDDLRQRIATAPKSGSKAAPLGLLVLFLAELAQAAGDEPGSRAAMQHPVRLHDAVARALQLLEGDIAHPWSLQELAGLLHIDRSYLVRLFKAGTGLAPMASLARLRAERAALLALQTNLPLAEIGRTVGWPDPNYFARRFRQYFGISATSYRARYAAARTRPDWTHGGRATEQWRDG
jgi:AraC family L-rhamnose operon transcriptional activator RhaR